MQERFKKKKIPSPQISRRMENVRGSYRGRLKTSATGSIQSSDAGPFGQRWRGILCGGSDSPVRITWVFHGPKNEVVKTDSRLAQTLAVFYAGNTLPKSSPHALLTTDGSEIDIRFCTLTFLSCFCCVTLNNSSGHKRAAFFLTAVLYSMVWLYHHF